MTRDSKRAIDSKEPVFTSDFADKISVFSSLDKGRQATNYQNMSFVLNPTLLRGSKKDSSKNPRNQRQLKNPSSLYVSK